MSKQLHNQQFSERYSKEFDFIRKSRRGDSYALCVLCNVDLSISHGGRSDIMAHSKTKKHIERHKCSLQPQKKILFAPDSDYQTIKAEVLFTNFLIEHNIPIAASDHASRLFTAMFPNSPEVKQFSCGRTKAGHIIKEIASNSTEKLVTILQNGPFTIATDGSNDSNIQMYPLVVTFFDESAGQISSNLLSLPCLEGVDSTGENIANLIIKEFEKFNIPFNNCISLACDNAYVMVGKKKGVYAFLKEKHDNLVVLGCLCHLINLAGEKGASTLPFSCHEFLTDVYFYFHRSVKRKNTFKAFQELYGEDCRKILKHGVTRWLSLGKCLSRLLDQWKALLMYFKEECKKDKVPKVLKSHPLTNYTIPKMKIATQTTLDASLNEHTLSNSAKKHKLKVENSSILDSQKKNSASRKRKASDLDRTQKNKKKFKPNISNVSVKQVKKLKEKNITKEILQREERIFLCLSNDLYHAIACFLKNIITVFDKYNTVLQSEIPKIHFLKSYLESFFTEFVQRFIKTEVIKSFKCVYDIKYREIENLKNDSEITIGSQAAECLKELSESETKLFYDHVKEYYATSCDYVISSFPIRSDILQHAEVADISKRETVSFSSVKFFTDKFPCLLMQEGTETKYDAVDKIEAEFLCYQTSDIPENITALERIDEKWAMLGKLKGAHSELQYMRLSKVMLGILTLPHSNASCERIFSLVRRNKTDFRSSMQQSTLQAILVAKSQMSGSPCFSQKYDKTFLKKAKSATTVALNKT